MSTGPALDPAGAAWLRAAIGSVTGDPTRVRALFPAVARHCGRSSGDPADPASLVTGGPDDAARVALLTALPLAGAALADEVAALYRFGDAGERRGVLRALGHLDQGPDGIGDRLVPVVRDALRTNDPRLLPAALGPYARRLDDAAWRQAVLKCLFTGVPLAAVAGLADRTDAELARVVVAFAHERVAAGRDVPADAWTVVDRVPGALAASGLPAELHSPVPARRAAARRALHGRPVHRQEA